nr:sodium-dependent bicarbonate transport family permease [Microvirga makkahensis]
MLRLELGIAAAQRTRDLRPAGPMLILVALGAPMLHVLLGLGAALLVGLSAGGAIVLATLAASATYIAAPAAVRLALPNANPGNYLGAALGLTFPFNIIIGISLYAAAARLIY